MNLNCCYFPRVLLVMSVLAVPTMTTSAATDAEEWKQLNAKKDELIGQLRELQQQFRSAKTQDQKEKIAEQFEGRRQELVSEVLPKVGKLAPKIFAADPKNTEAGETAMELAFQENRYEDVAALSDKLIGAGDKSMIVQNMRGVALFGLHQFDQAQEVLAAAKAAGELHPQLGGQFLAASEAYGPLWEQEQKVRAAEAKLPADKLLPQVQFDTTKGPIIFELFEDQAPNTVANFISLVESKTYDGVKFHRVIPTFMAQGGDPLSKDDVPENDGTGGPGYVIDCECYRPDARMHFRGSLSMAHAGKDSGGSQFFITHLPTAHLNPKPDEERGHTVFGRIVEGMDVAASLTVGDEIKTAAVLRKRNHPYKPVTKPDPRR